MDTIKLTFVIVTALLVFAACNKKTAPTPSPLANGTILLSEIIDNNPNDKDYTSAETNSGIPDSTSTGYGQPIFVFFYNGAQLSKLIKYASSKLFLTNLFNYDSQGRLTGTTRTATLNGQVIPPGNFDVASTTISYSGNNISEQKYYTQNNVLYHDVTYTWQNGEIVSLTDNPSGIAGYANYTNTYLYDSSNNNTSFTTTYGGSINNLSFDSKANLSAAFPFWWVVLGPDATEASFTVASSGYYEIAVPVIPGAHNQLTDDEGYTYSYQYNSNNYPSEETVIGQGNKLSVQYRYIQVN